MAAPEIQDLLGFDDPLVLFPVNGHFESNLRDSGASFLVKTSGTAVMRFEVGPNWTFKATGEQKQETSKPGVVADQQDSMTMSWSLSTALNDALDVEVRVVMSMDGEITHEVRSKVLKVKYAA